MTVVSKNVTSSRTSGETASEEEAPARSNTGLIILVVALGVAILAMMGLIIFKVIAGDAKKSSKPAEKVAVVASVAPADYHVKKPEGAVLASSSLQGAEVLLHFKTQDGNDVLIILDRKTGQQSKVFIAP